MIRAGWPRGVALVTIAFSANLLLMQRSACWDGPWLLLMLRREEDLVDANYLYLPIVDAWCALLEPLGISQYTAAAAASALFTALGTGFVYAAGRALTSRQWTALLAAALTAVTPSVMFHGTAVETNGVFFGFCGLATWLAARLCVRPRPGLAVLLGISTGVATMVHASGILLPLPLLGLCFVRLRAERGLRSVAALAIVTGLAHLATVVFGPDALGAALSLPVPQAGSAVDAVAHYLAVHGPHPERVPGNLAREWVWAYAPMSLLWLAAFANPARRVEALVFLAVLLPYLVGSFVMLGSDHAHGAYLLGVAWPLTWIVVRAVPRRIVLASIAVSAGIAAAQIAIHDQRERPQRYASGVRQIAEGRPLLLLTASYHDDEACAITLPDASYLYLPDLVVADPAVLESSLPALVGYLTDHLSAGGCTCLTGGAEDVLRNHPGRSELPNAQRLLEVLERAFEWRRVAMDGFRGVKLLRREAR